MIRSSSSTSSGARPSSSSAIERWWISARRAPALLVERGAAHLVEQLLDHRADPHDLGRLLDQVGRVGGALAGLVGGRVVVRRHAHPVGGDDHDALAVAGHGDRHALALGVVLVGLGPVLLAHGPILPHVPAARPWVRKWSAGAATWALSGRKGEARGRHPVRGGTRRRRRR